MSVFHWITIETGSETYNVYDVDISTVKRIDSFAHVIPKDVHDTVAAEAAAGENQFEFPSHFWDRSARLADMDRHGIDKQVLALSPPTIWTHISDDELLPFVEFANDRVAEYADATPERFLPVASIPRVDEKYVAEVKRCIEDLGMIGVQLFSNVNGQPLDDPPCLELYEYAERNGVPLWIHPQSHSWYPWINSFEERVFGWLFDTALAQCRLVFSGVLEAYPDLQILIHHMGSLVPHFYPRIDEFYQRQSVSPYTVREKLTAAPSEYFQSLYVDTVTNGSRQSLERGLDFYGTAQILFASDYPFGPGRSNGLGKNVQTVNDILADTATKQAIFADNFVTFRDPDT